MRRDTKPGDLPVQFCVKFGMAVNLKSAKALGLAARPSILLRADEVSGGVPGGVAATAIRWTSGRNMLGLSLSGS
jgi:hypothetical protein